MHRNFGDSDEMTYLCGQIAKPKNKKPMTRYSIGIDDALMEEVKPHIGKDIAIQIWLEEMVHNALLSYAAQFATESKSRSERICQQVKALGDTPEGFFALHTVLKPSMHSPEELRDEYISEKYGV